MSGITVTVGGVSKVVSNIRKAITRINDGCIDGVNKSLKDIKSKAVENLNSTRINANPRAHAIGYGQYAHFKINQSWKISPITNTGSIYEGWLDNLSDHASFVEFGTAKEIRPIGNKPLKYQDGVGNWRQAIVVSGQPPKSFLRQAIQTQNNNIPNIISNAIKTRLVTI